MFRVLWCLSASHRSGGGALCASLCWGLVGLTEARLAWKEKALFLLFLPDFLLTTFIAQQNKGCRQFYMYNVCDVSLYYGMLVMMMSIIVSLGYRLTCSCGRRKLVVQRKCGQKPPRWIIGIPNRHMEMKRLNIAQCFFYFRHIRCRIRHEMFPYMGMGQLFVPILKNIIKYFIGNIQALPYVFSCVL